VRCVPALEVFYINAAALTRFDTAGGFEVGVGPTVIVVDEGKAKTMTTTTSKDPCRDCRAPGSAPDRTKAHGGQPVCHLRDGPWLAA